MRYIAGLLLLAGCSGNGALGSGVDMAPSSDSVTLISDMFKVPAGGEVFACQNFKNPFGGVDTDIQAYESHMSKGSHHMLLFFQDNAVDTPVAPCSGLEFTATPYGAQDPDATVTFPDGIASLIKGTQGLRMNMHYLNATQSDLMAQVTMIFHKATPGSVQQHAGIFFLNDVSMIHVPAGATQMVSATCTVPQAANLLYGLGHMHQFTTHMNATLNGTSIYDTDSWSASPLVKYDPAMPAAVGSQITWTSTINNTTDHELTFGESAMTNEMSIFDGHYYPADPNNPTYNCMQ